MSKFYYIDSAGQQQGLFSPEELQQMRVLQPTTPIWAEGMANWTEAADVPELAFIFQTAAPQQSYGAPQGAPQFYGASDRPDSWLAWSIVATILCCWPCGIPAIVYAAKVDSLWNEKRYEEAMVSAKNARTWTIAAAISGGVIWLLYIGLVFAGVMSNVFYR